MILKPISLGDYILFACHQLIFNIDIKINIIMSYLRAKGRRQPDSRFMVRCKDSSLCVTNNSAESVVGTLPSTSPMLTAKQD